MRKSRKTSDYKQARSFSKILLLPVLAGVLITGSTAYAVGPTPPPVPVSGAVGPAPTISVLVVPNPTTLAAAGSVTYTYTVKNVGPTFVPMTGVTLTDDNCATVTYVSGDTNANATLDATEVWTYTCTASVAATTTSTATVTGHAGDLVATDTASATVNVGAGVLVAPMIQVVKMTRHPVLPAGGGLVMYGFSVTNPGTVPLTGVAVTDSKCSPITIDFGDTNSNNGIPVNSTLNPNETWQFACITTNVTVNTVDAATATATGNGMTATDYGYATVIVMPGAAPTPTPTPTTTPTTPTLPNTGIGPDASGTPWNMVTFPIALVAASLLLFALRRKNAMQFNK